MPSPAPHAAQPVEGTVIPGSGARIYRIIGLLVLSAAVSSGWFYYDWLNHTISLTAGFWAIISFVGLIFCAFAVGIHHLSGRRLVLGADRLQVLEWGTKVVVQVP